MPEPKQGIWKLGTLAIVTARSITAKERLNEIDIGADPEKSKREGIHLGTKQLFSDEMLKPLRLAERAAYNAVFSYSVRFPIGRLRFVSWSLLDRCRESFAEAEDQHRKAVKDLLRQFDAFRDEMIGRYPDQLREEDYWRTKQLLQTGHCRVRFNTATLEMTGDTKNEERSIMAEFAEDAVRDLRETVGSAATRVAKNLADGKPISERSLNALRRMVEKAELVNFINDPVTTNALAAMRRELDGRSAKALRENEADSRAFRRALEGIVKEAGADTDIKGITRGFVRRVVDIGEAEAEPTANPKRGKREVG